MGDNCVEDLLFSGKPNNLCTTGDRVHRGHLQRHAASVRRQPVRCLGWDRTGRLLDVTVEEGSTGGRRRSRRASEKLSKSGFAGAEEKSGGSQACQERFAIPFHLGPGPFRVGFLRPQESGPSLLNQVGPLGEFVSWNDHLPNRHRRFSTEFVFGFRYCHLASEQTVPGSWIRPWPHRYRGRVRSLHPGG